MKNWGSGEWVSVSGKPLPGHDLGYDRKEINLRNAKKDEHCDCKCHEELGWSDADCPLCYFTDGFAGLNKRIDEHDGKISAEMKRRGLR